MPIVFPVAAALLIAVAAPPTSSAPGVVWPEALGPGTGAICRDRIHQIRARRGLPHLQRETASPAEPLFIAAVDKCLDGCRVLVMHHDTSDIRPIPKLPEGSGGEISAQ